MSGISTGVGLFSGINTGQLIEQLISIEARPRDQAQRRIAQLQLQQTAYLDLNSKLAALRTAAGEFRTAKTFKLKSAVTSDDQVLTATAGTDAIPGSYSFLVDRLVSTQQFLSRGFANRASAAVGSGPIVIETARARLDNDVALADLNNGQGVARGKIVITDSGNRSATVDLSRATTVNDVLDAINGNGTALVTARVEGGRLVIADNTSTTAAPVVADAAGSTTATSLGLTTGSTTTGGVRTGAVVYALNTKTTLQSFNDGNGVSINNSVGEQAFNFTIQVNRGGSTTSVNVNIGDVYETQTINGEDELVKVKGAATDAGEVIARINQAMVGAGLGNVTAAIDQTNGRLQVTDGSGGSIQFVENADTTAADLGLTTGAAQTGTFNGRRIFAGLNTVLASTLAGGQGIKGDGAVNVTLRDGATFSLSVNAAGTLQDVMKQIETASAGRVRVTLNHRGTGLQVQDLTTGSGNLIIKGTDGADTAIALGISTGATGVASNTVTGNNLQRQYLSRATLLADLPIGRPLGVGQFRITDADGQSATVDIGTDSQTLGDIIDEINSRGIKVKARINANGDGLEIIEDLQGGPAGSAKIKIEEVNGSIARSLNILGEATGTGAQNAINGTFERSVAVTQADTLDAVVRKINEARAGVTAAVIRDGSGSAPYRLSLSASGTGRAGRMVIDTGAFDLGLTTLDAGEDARIFFGSSDAARAVAVTSSSNTVDTLIPGLKLDLRSPGDDEPVTVTVSDDTTAIMAKVTGFVQSFNTLVGKIGDLTKYDVEAKRGGALLGDSAALELRAALYRVVQGRAVGASGRFSSLVQVGITVGAGGQLKLDEAKFRQALAEDPASVESLFTLREQIDTSTTEIEPGITVRNTSSQEEFSALGPVNQIEQLAKRYLDTVGGTLTLRQRGLETQIKLQEGRIEAFNTRLESRRLFLRNQFTQMERTLGQLQSQQSAIGQIARR